MARRLVEVGVPFVEVSMGGWDLHQNCFTTLETKLPELDKAMSALVDDLSQRGLLENTVILWMGEFGRTPRINGNAGRDHFPAAWSAVLAGGGIAGGQAYGATSDDGTAVVDGQVTAQDLLATLCAALGVIGAYNMSPSGRPIPVTEGIPIAPVLS